MKKKFYIFFTMSRDLFKGSWRYLFGFMVLFGVLTSIAPMIIPVVLRYVFDALEKGNPETVLKVSIIAGICVVIFFILCYFLNVYADPFLDKFINGGKSKIFIAYHKLPFGEKVQKYDEGDVFNRINAASNGIAMTWLELTRIAGMILSISILLILSIMTSWWLAIFASIITAIDYIRVMYETRKNAEFAQELQVLEGKREDTLYTIINNIEVLSMHGNRNILLDKYKALRDTTWNIKRKQTFINLYLNIFRDIVYSGFRSILSLIMISIRFESSLSVGKITSSFSLFDSLCGSLLGVRFPIVSLPNYLIPIEMLDELLSVKRYIVENNIEESKSKVAISVHNVSLTFEEKNILNNISLTIKSREKVAIIGKNGCGKSSLLRTIIGNYLPSKGACYIYEQNSAKMNLSQRRNIITYIPSNSQLFDESVYCNIEMGAEDNELESLSLIAQNLNIIGDYEEYINDKASSLSGGQAQRVNIARGMIHNSPIIFADEPNASLDSIIGEKMIKSLINNYETVVVVTHHPEFLAYFNRVIILEDGTVAADGSLMELSNHPAYIRWCSKS